MAYEDLEALLRADRTVEHGLGATDADISAAEERLGPLAAEYQRFLRDFGWLAVRQYEVNGTGPDVPRHLDVVALGLEERADFGLAPNLVPILNDGGGNLYCLDSTAGGGIDAVLFWDHETGPSQGPTVVASSFSDWLLGLLSGTEGA